MSPTKKSLFADFFFIGSEIDIHKLSCNWVSLHEVILKMHLLCDFLQYITIRDIKKEKEKEKSSWFELNKGFKIFAHSKCLGFN